MVLSSPQTNRMILIYQAGRFTIHYCVTVIELLVISPIEPGEIVPFALD